MQKFSIALIVYSVGVLVTLLVCVPSWPFLYNRHPIKWLPPIDESELSDDEEVPADNKTGSKSLWR